MKQDRKRLQEWATQGQADKVKAIWGEPRLQQIVEAFTEFEIKLYLVGGVVRDLLLGRPCNDIDLVVGCSADELFELAREHKKNLPGTHVPLDKERGTLRLCFSDQEEFDLVALQGIDLDSDLRNRDLAINAMAIDSQGTLFDPTDGSRDLREGVIRGLCQSNFRDDPLRVLRCLRFAAQLDFELEPETWAWAKQAMDGLSGVAGERISAELTKFFWKCRPKQLQSFVELPLSRVLFEVDHEPVPLLAEAISKGNIGESNSLELGLALWLGERCAPKEVARRLRFSKKTQRYLEKWANGLAVLRQASESLETVYLAWRATGEVFCDMAMTAQLDAFPVSLSSDFRTRWLREARGEGDLNWDPLPWTSEEIMTELDRGPGPWLGALLTKAQLEWACGRLESLEDIKELVRV